MWRSDLVSGNAETPSGVDGNRPFLPLYTFTDKLAFCFAFDEMGQRNAPLVMADGAFDFYICRLLGNADVFLPPMESAARGNR